MLRKSQLYFTPWDVALWIKQHPTSNKPQTEMPRKVRFADENTTINTNFIHKKLFPEIQQQSSSAMKINIDNSDRREDHVSGLTGVMIAQLRAEEAMMRARAIQSNMRRRNEVLHHVVECENRQQQRKSIENAREEEVYNDTDLLSVSMAWISEVFHDIRMKWREFTSSFLTL